MRFTPILFFSDDCYCSDRFEIPRLKGAGARNTPDDDRKRIEMMLKMIKIWYFSFGGVAWS